MNAQIIVLLDLTSLVDLGMKKGNAKISAQLLIAWTTLLQDAVSSIVGKSLICPIISNV